MLRYEMGSQFGSQQCNIALLAESVSALHGKSPMDETPLGTMAQGSHYPDLTY